MVEKREVNLPDELRGIVKCANPKCITNNEPMPTLFHVVDKENCVIKCHYCEKRTDKRGHRDNLMKEDWKPGTMIYPLPAVLVSCGSTPEEYNILTVAWTGDDLHKPAHVLHFRTAGTLLLRHHQTQYGVCHQPDNERYGARHRWCGVRSGKSYNKFEEMKLTPGKSTVVSAPLIEESPCASNAG